MLRKTRDEEAFIPTQGGYSWTVLVYVRRLWPLNMMMDENGGEEVVGKKRWTISNHVFFCCLGEFISPDLDKSFGRILENNPSFLGFFFFRKCFIFLKFSNNISLLPNT